MQATHIPCKIMSHCPQLEVLWIGQAHFLVPKAWKMERKRTGRGVHGLRSLILGKNNHVSADDLDILFNNDHANLVALYITQSATASSLSVNMVLGRLRAFAYDGEGSADTAAQFISSSPCLAHIELQNCLITARLIKALSDAPHLESIALSFNSYDQETICMLLKSLSSRHLNRLYYKERGRTVVASILEAFTWVQTLEHITIDLVGPCAFDRDTAVSWVKRLLGSLTNLQSLTLIGLDRISNTFLNAIAVHSVGTRLTSLCLRECSLVTSEALEALAHHQTTTLREVSVERCYGLWGIMQLPTTGGRLHLIVR
ncbi:hypothetical protein BX666DRAFT_61400 [Dichotomocladium elegans]|nr:hypothetical protein BX666DRAFT_61400 [Dichotomocladium elegans]